MKNLLLAIFIIPLFVHAQNFSGEITYEIKVIPKSDTVDLKRITDQKEGTTAKYLITAKRYKSSYFKDGEYSYSYTYDDETKRMYDDYADKPYMTFRDSRKSNGEYGKSIIRKDSTTTVLGHLCYMVISESEYGKSKTYYSDDIKVDYNDFEGHKVGNWYNELKEVDGAISLKTITDHDTYIEIQEAIKIDERKVKEKEFDLPEKELAASFTALDNQVEMKQPTQNQIQCYQKKVGSVSKMEGEKYICYISFILKKDGQMKFIEAYEEDDDGFYKVALDVVENCGFEFNPGTIAGELIDSEVYFPIEFLK